MAKILGINGSLRDGSNTFLLVRAIAAAAERCGAEVRMFDLRENPLPLFEGHKTYHGHEVVQRLMESFLWADGIILGSPEYHGAMSGGTKNMLDFLYREMAGRLFGLAAATGGSQGNGCFDNMRASIQYCHGWTLPYNIAATGRDFGPDGNLIVPKIQDRVDRMGRDLTVYGPILRQQFERDQAQPAEQPQGFAHWSV